MSSLLTSGWFWLVAIAGLVVYKMVLPIARAMQQERRRQAALPPGHVPKVRDPEAFDDEDDWPGHR